MEFRGSGHLEDFRIFVMYTLILRPTYRVHERESQDEALRCVCLLWQGNVDESEFAVLFGWE